MQAIHHSEQVQAARVEFAEFWLKERMRPFIKKLGSQGRFKHEITAWNAFLKAKGLK